MKHLFCQSILRQSIDPNRVFYRDFQRFFSVLIDDSIRNTICRLYLTPESKKIAFLDEKHVETKYDITTLDDIFKYSELLINTAQKYVKDKQAE